MSLTNLKREHLEIIFFLVLTLILSIFWLLLSYSVTYKKIDAEKLLACVFGFDPFGSGASAFKMYLYIAGGLLVSFVIFTYNTLLLCCFYFINRFKWIWVAVTFVVVRFKMSKKIKLLGVTVVGTSPRQGCVVGNIKTTPIYPNCTCDFDQRLGCCLGSAPGRTEKLIFAIKLVGKNAWVLKWLSKKLFLTGLILATLIYFQDNTLLLVILPLLIFAATKQAFGFRWTYIEKYRIISKGLIYVMVAILLLHFCYIINYDHIVWQDLAVISHQQYVVSDYYTRSIKIYLFCCTIIFLILTTESLIRYSILKEINLVEFPLIIGFALFFMFLLISSFNLFGAYVSLEGITFSLYILAGMNYNSQNSLEAGMKYFCLGALSSGFLLFGIALTFIMTKTLDFGELRFLFEGIEELPLLLSFALIFIFFGFWFKLSIFPCHAWTPDVYEGVLTPVTFFFATVVKLSVFAFFARVLFFLLGSKGFLFFWQPFFLFVAVGSIVFGALGALLQTKIKRFIGYTAINQMGYLLIGVSSGDFFGLQASFLYLFFYLIMGISFFSVLLYITDSNGKEILFINQLHHFGVQHRNLSIILALVLFSMAGIPPLAGFFGKFFLFFSAFKAGNHSIVFLGLVMNVISAFYYLRIIKCLFFCLGLQAVEHEKKNRSKIRSTYSFFLGTDDFFPILFDAILLFCLFLLLVAPFFLNSLLHYFNELAVSAAFINEYSRFY
jgi:NADH-quinone oxidoreductase subunit N